MDTRRSILEKVKDGTLSPEEAAEELERLATDDDPGDAEAAAPRKTIHIRHRKIEHTEDGAPEGLAKRIRIVGDFRTAKITGDASVVEAVSEGVPAYRDGDTLVIDAHIGDNQEDRGFTFRKSDRAPRIVIGMGSKPRPVSVRMNPDLPLEVRIDAGTVHISGVHSEIHGDVDAGAIRIEDVQSPFDLSVDAGSINVSGVIRTGDSRIKCDAGAIKVLLKPGSSVKVRAHTDVGSVRLGREKKSSGLHIGGREHEAVFGAGDATLDIAGSLGRIVVDEE